MLIDRVLGLVSMVLLARLLAPDDFGVVAMCMSVVALIQAFTSFGFDAALIQQKEITRAHYDTVWTIKSGIGMLIAMILLSTAGPASIAYGDERIANPLMLLSLSVIATGLSNARVVELQRSLQFRRETIFRLAVRLTGFTFTLVAALVWRDYWALIWGIIATEIARLVLSFLFVPAVPRVTLSRWRELFAFSIWMVVGNGLLFLKLRLSHFVVGTVFGAAKLGSFQLAQDLVHAPTTAIGSAVNRGVYPTYAKIANDTNALREAVLGVISGVALLIVPVGVGIAAISEPLVLVVFGEVWLAAIPVVFWVSLAAVFSALYANMAYVFFATGNPRRVTTINAVQIAFLIPGLILLANLSGFDSIAIAILISEVVTLLAFLIALRREISIRATDFLNVTWRPVIASLFMYTGVLATSNYFAENVYSISGLLGVITVGGLSYVITVSLFAALFTTGKSYERRMIETYVAPLFNRA